jgi:hypothetical protein
VARNLGDDGDRRPGFGRGRIWLQVGLALLAVFNFQVLLCVTVTVTALPDGHPSPWKKNHPRPSDSESTVTWHITLNLKLTHDDLRLYVRLVRS